MPKKGKGKQQVGKGPPICTYCGERPADTRDHVLPKALFTRPLPLFMVTVPVCDACNEAKSRNDDYLRDMLVSDVYSSEHPTAQALLKTKVVSSVEQDKSVVARAAARWGRRVPFYTPSGLFATHFYTVPLEEKRVQRIFTDLTKGLYYQLLKKYIPKDYRFDVERVESSHAEELYEIMKQMGANGPYCLGNKAEFCCVFMYGEEDPGVTWWILQFYSGIFITVRTLAPQASEHNKETHFSF